METTIRGLRLFGFQLTIYLATQYDCNSVKFSCVYTVAVFILFSLLTPSHMNIVGQ